ncbi:MAG: hypothetical protein QGG40_03940, partial [Myxococcota bacterium]|nr:hypothetical protein [Myxococcota bacterium]
MAVRQATRTYSGLKELLEAVQGNWKQQTVMLPAGTVDGDLANEIKLDLVLPGAGRVGPLQA